MFYGTFGGLTPPPNTKKLATLLVPYASELYWYDIVLWLARCRQADKLWKFLLREKSSLKQDGITLFTVLYTKTPCWNNSMWGSKGASPPCTPTRGSAPSNPAGGFTPRPPLSTGVSYHFQIPSDGPACLYCNHSIAETEHKQHTNTEKLLLYILCWHIRGGPKRMQRFWSVISTTLLIEYRWFLLYWIEFFFPSNLTPSSSSYG